jgi:pimeloyl-ACP methyl ester carboxylesterase
MAGAMGPGFAADDLAADIKQVTGDCRVTTVTFGTALSFDACRSRVLQAVEAAFPSNDPCETSEVDVVAFSMGGLVARYAALPVQGEAPRKRLRIKRLFTISTPHRGARVATLPLPHPLLWSMRPGSPLLKQLDDGLADADYELHTYVQSGDLIVGEVNAAPVNYVAYRTSQERLDAHNAAPRDPRIKLDIARRLRGLSATLPSANADQ